MLNGAMDQEEEEQPGVILYASEQQRVEDMEDSYIKKIFKFNPCNNDWDLLQALLFLNSLKEFKSGDKLRFNKGRDGYYFTLKFDHVDDEESFVHCIYYTEIKK